MTGDMLVLAVDGGQTSSKAMVATLDGTVLGRGTGSPCDHLHGPDGYERNRDAIHSSGRAAIRAAGVDPERIVAVGLGLTSAPRESEALPLFERMVREFLNPHTLWVDADFVSNLAGASGVSPGVVVIAGGGSIGYGHDHQGREAIAGGMGYLMGDEGSGWYIGLLAIQEAARAADLRGPETALLPMVLEHYGLRTIREIIRQIYAVDFTRDQISTLVPEVVRVAEDGDAVAQSIISGAGVRLGEIALGTIRQLHAPGEVVDVYPTGGVFQAGASLRGPFARTVGTGWPTAVIREPKFPPVVGAYLKARDRMGMSPSSDVLDRLEATFDRSPLA